MTSSPPAYGRNAGGSGRSEREGCSKSLPGRRPLGKSEAVIKLHFRLGQGYGLGTAWRNYSKKKVVTKRKALLVLTITACHFAAAMQR